MRKWKGRKSLSYRRSCRERDRNFPSGIFLPRKAADKEISSCIFLQAANISRRLRESARNVATRFRFIGFVIIRTARRAWNEGQTDRQIDGSGDITRCQRSNLQDISMPYSRYLMKINWRQRATYKNFFHSVIIVCGLKERRGKNCYWKDAFREGKRGWDAYIKGCYYRDGKISVQFVFDRFISW